MIIERGEYEARQAAALAAASHGGFSGLIAWSRGGSTQDQYAEVYYLTGFYTHYPIIPDLPGRWRAQGHTALVLPVDGPSTLILDVARRQAPEPVADRVVWANDVLDALARAVEETVERGVDVGLVGGEALTWKWGRELAARLRWHRLIEVDELGAEIRLFKSPAELGLIRAAGAVGAAAVTAAMRAAVPGVTEAEIAAIAIS